MERSISRLCAIAFLLMPAARATSADLRQMYAEPGEWLITIGGTLIPHTRAKICSRNQDAIAEIVTSRLSNCSRKSADIGAGTATVDADCTISGVHVAAHATVTPTGDQSWRAVSAVHIQGLPSGSQTPAIDLTMTIVAKRLGACPDEKKPS